MPGKVPDPQNEADEEPHYHGHRERLRERFFSAGPDALTDYELLEMALFAAIPRRDTKPLAKELLKKFGSFTEVIHAPAARLREVKGIKDASISQLKLLAAASSRAARREIERKVALSSWNDVIDYCRYSAMPVGRFMLDVHGEDRATWPANDTLCAALQINNHLQDCRKDYRDLNRVYVPLDALAAAGAAVEDLGAVKASPALRACLKSLAERNEALLMQCASFSSQVKDVRLGMEISVIDTFARKIVNLLKTRDPLSENVHLSKLSMLMLAAIASGLEIGRRAAGVKSMPRLSTGA